MALGQQSLIDKGDNKFMAHGDHPYFADEPDTGREVSGPG